MMPLPAGASLCVLRGLFSSHNPLFIAFDISPPLKILLWHKTATLCAEFAIVYLFSLKKLRSQASRVLFCCVRNKNVQPEAQKKPKGQYNRKFCTKIRELLSSPAPKHTRLRNFDRRGQQKTEGDGSCVSLGYARQRNRPLPSSHLTPRHLSK